MKLLWPLAFILSLVATGTGVRVSGDNPADGALFSNIFLASSIAAVVLMVVLLVDYYRATGSRYRGSDLTRMRIAVIGVGDVAIILLAIQIWSAGIGLLVLTAAFFAHGTVSAKETVALHAKWEAERLLAYPETAPEVDLETKPQSESV